MQAEWQTNNSVPPVAPTICTRIRVFPCDYPLDVSSPACLGPGKPAPSESLHQSHAAIRLQNRPSRQPTMDRGRGWDGGRRGGGGGDRRKLQRKKLVGAAYTGADDVDEATAADDDLAFARPRPQAWSGGGGGAAPRADDLGGLAVAPSDDLGGRGGGLGGAPSDDLSGRGGRGGGLGGAPSDDLGGRASRGGGFGGMPSHDLGGRIGAAPRSVSPTVSRSLSPSDDLGGRRAAAPRGLVGTAPSDDLGGPVAFAGAPSDDLGGAPALAIGGPGFALPHGRAAAPADDIGGGGDDSDGADSDEDLAARAREARARHAAAAPPPLVDTAADESAKQLAALEGSVQVRRSPRPLPLADGFVFLFCRFGSTRPLMGLLFFVLDAALTVVTDGFAFFVHTIAVREWIPTRQTLALWLLGPPRTSCLDSAPLHCNRTHKHTHTHARCCASVVTHTHVVPGSRPSRTRCRVSVEARTVFLTTHPRVCRKRPTLPRAPRLMWRRSRPALQRRPPASRLLRCVSLGPC